MAWYYRTVVDDESKANTWTHVESLAKDCTAAAEVTKRKLSRRMRMKVAGVKRKVVKAVSR